MTTRPRPVAHLLRILALTLLCAGIVGAACAVLAPGSREVLTDIGPVPIDAKDEMRVTGEVWFAIAMAALAVLTTVVWWRRGRWRGPVGIIGSTVAAVAQSGFAWLVWLGVVALRGFSSAGEKGEVFLRAPVISDPAPLLLAGVCAVLTYGAMTMAAARSDLSADEAPGAAMAGCEAGNSRAERNLER